MAFGRKKRAEEAEEAVAAEETPVVAERPVTTGPWDPADGPDDELSRVDLGGLRVLVPEGVEVRVEVSPEGQVVAATAVDRGSQLQLNAFAAPKSDGIWSEVRTEIAEALRAQGGSAEEVDGPLGPELRARIPAGNPGHTTPARFLGTDGPRWFLRGMITGPASTDVAQASRLLETYRGTVVVRGSEAMAPRDALPLRLPREAAAAAAELGHEDHEGHDHGDAAPGHIDDLNPFERGPEITETR
ncbi:MAG TPA: DUF3710 domain-containing protein [Mycobacteriales bacterium]|nr:DUF3710 domain-containing protein [Mycobacteriales bacterium]